MDVLWIRLPAPDVEQERVNDINFPEEVLDQEYKYNKIVINM